jgi:glutaredoxin
MKTAVLYTDGGQESERLRQLLLSLDGEYLEYNLGKDFTQSQFYKEFGSNAEYPQVAIGSKHIGGLKDTLHYLKDEGLI